MTFPWASGYVLISRTVAPPVERDEELVRVMADSLKVATGIGSLNCRVRMSESRSRWNPVTSGPCVSGVNTVVPIPFCMASVMELVLTANVWDSTINVLSADVAKCGFSLRAMRSWLPRVTEIATAALPWGAWLPLVVSVRVCVGRVGWFWNRT